MRTLTTWLLALALPFAAVGEDKVYKWVDEKGVVHYTDQPPSDDAKPAKLPPLQTYKGAVPDLQRYDKPRVGADGKPVKPAGTRNQIDVVTPSQDETFRGAERVVPVAVVVTPPLKADQRLIYFLDGTPQSLPTPDTSHNFTGVDRGTHSVSVALVDAAGQELARSNSVTVHVKPPIVKR